MYTTLSVPYDISGNVYEYRGLSSDTKPIGHDDHGRKVGNGSVFFEMDTSKQFMYNEEAKQWVELTVVV